jgi:hypothetical protein
VTSATGLELLGILETDGKGRANAVPIPDLANRLGIPRRAVQALAVELIDAGVLVGSFCIPGRNGLFLIEDMADLEAGTRHIIARAVSSLRRVRTLKRAAQERFGPDALTLFDLDREASGGPAGAVPGGCPGMRRVSQGPATMPALASPAVGARRPR